MAHMQLDAKSVHGLSVNRQLFNKTNKIVLVFRKTIVKKSKVF